MKKNLKSAFIFLISGILGGSMSFAYQPNANEKAYIDSLIPQLSIIAKSRLDLRNFYQQARDFSTLLQKESATHYQSQFIRDFLLDRLESQKKDSKLASLQGKIDFLAERRGSGLQLAHALDKNCTGWYQTMDSLSYVYNFPTALTIAVWRKESNCGYYLPKNGDGPFQIVSKNYGTGTITPALFEQTIKDFLLFSQNKINRYNSRNPQTKIQLSYDNFSYTDLHKFSALYNGLSGGNIYGDITPAAPRYFFEKMPGAFAEGKRNGLFAQFLRILERETTQ